MKSNTEELALRSKHKYSWLGRMQKEYIFLRTSTCFSLRSYSCLIFFFSASTNCSFSMLNSYNSTQKLNKEDIYNKELAYGLKTAQFITFSSLTLLPETFKMFTKILLKKPC